MLLQTIVCSSINITIIFFIILFIVFKKKIIPLIKKTKKEYENFDKNLLHSYEEEYDIITRKSIILEVKINLYQKYEHDAEKWKLQKEKINKDHGEEQKNIALVNAHKQKKIEESRLKKKAQNLYYAEIKNAFINECQKRNLQTNDVFDNALYTAKKNTQKIFSLKGK